MKGLKALCCALLALSFLPAARATEFPAPAYEWTLENTSPDGREMQAAADPWWDERAEMGAASYGSGTNRIELLHWVGHSQGYVNLVDALYGVEDGPRIAAARPVAEALLDSLGLDYIREPALAKTAWAYQTDSWLRCEAFIDTDGTILWLCDQLAREPMDMTAVPTLAYYTEMRQKWVEEQYTSPEDVILRYRVALGGLPLAEETANERQPGMWQLIVVIVTPEGKVIRLNLQNARFAVKGRTEVSTPVTLAEAEQIALSQYPYWQTAATYRQDAPAFRESLKALSGYESLNYTPRLESAEPVYMRVGSDRAVPAWALSFRYDYVLDGEVVPVEGYPEYVRLFVSATDGTLLLP